MAIHRFSRLAEDWRELEGAGIPLEPVDFRVGLDSRGLLIRHEPHPYEYGYVREIQLGRITYMVPVFIRRDAPGKIIIRNCTLCAPWDDFIELLDEDTGKNAGWYAFSEGKHEYPRDMVLNHRVTGTLSRGDIRAGVLLGIGRVSPPEKYRSGDKIPIILTIFDQWDRELPAVFELPLTRCPKPPNQIAKRKRPSLLSCRDVAAPDKLIARPGSDKNAPADQEWENLYAALNGISDRGRSPEPTARSVGSRKGKELCKV
jgi:hypothetical protein